MSSHLTTLNLVLPSQVFSNATFDCEISGASDGTAATVATDGWGGSGAGPANKFAAEYADIGGQNDTIPGLVFPSSQAFVGAGFPMFIDADSSADPLNVPLYLFLTTTEPFVVYPANNGLTVTVVNEINVGNLPSAPSGTPVALAATTTSVFVTYGAAVAGTGSSFSELNGSPIEATITGYVVQHDQTGLRSTANRLYVQTPAHSAWQNNASSSSLLIDATAVALPVASPPTVAATVTAINVAAVPGVTAYAIGSGTTETMVLVSTNATLTLADNSGAANALTVLGYAGPPASVLGAVGGSVITGLPTSLAGSTFHVFAVSGLGNGPMGQVSNSVTT